MNYQELRLAVEKRIPQIFYSGVIKPINRDNKDLGDSDRNLQNISIVSKEDGTKYELAYEGQRWFFNALLAIQFYNDHKLLPDLFIFSFLRESEYPLAEMDNEMYRTFIQMSLGKLVQEGYGHPHHRSKTLLIESQRSFFLKADLFVQGRACLRTIIKNADLFADLIVDVVGSITEECYYFYN